LLELNKIHHGDCLELMKEIPDNTIDLIVTSPPYDNLRTYNGFSFDFECVANELYRITKQGGIVVWVVGDATIKGSETGTSFRQALYFKEIGFNLHDTMIYSKRNPVPYHHNRYNPTFEYMFVISKGKPKIFNALKEPTNKRVPGKFRYPDGSLKEANSVGGKEFKLRGNVWSYSVGKGGSTNDAIAFEHSAIFPEKLAEDHIKSWSNSGDIVFDPFSGSGTTCKMAMMNNRKYLGCEISQEYIDIANKRIKEHTQQLTLI
jgi:DNA modification methylase